MVQYANHKGPFLRISLYQSISCRKGMEKRLYGKRAFGQFSSNKAQRPNTLGATKVELNWLTEPEWRLMLDFNKGDVIIKQAGIYLLIAGPQVGKVSGTTPRWLDFWVRVNDVDVPNSNVRVVVTDPQEKTVIPLNVVLPLNSGDILNIIMATETIDEGLGVEAIAPIGEPTIPSIILTLVQLD